MAAPHPGPPGTLDQDGDAQIGKRTGDPDTDTQADGRNGGGSPKNWCQHKSVRE